MPPNRLAPLAIIGLTLLFLLLWDSPPERFLGDKSEIAAKAKYPVYILHRATTRRYSDEGDLTSIFTAAESRHFQVHKKRRSNKDYAELTEPHITLYSTDAPPWEITANTGKAKNNGHHIELWGDVRIWQTNSEGELSELTTPYLVVKPEKQYAETNKPVTINFPGSKTRAIGMKAYLQQDKIQLLSRVRGIHEPI